jgi:hypothetical protein
MIKERGILWLAVVAALTLAACSGDESTEVADSPPQTTAAPTTTTAPTTSTIATTTTIAPTTSTIATTTTIAPTPEELAAAFYLEKVAGVNCSRDLLRLALAEAPGGERIYPNEFNDFMAAMRPAYEMNRDAALTFMNEIAVYEWPADVQSNIDALVAEMAQGAGEWDQYAKSLSTDDWPTEFTDRNAATIVRAKLGIPSNINSQVNNCEEFFGG